MAVSRMFLTYSSVLAFFPFACFVLALLQIVVERQKGVICDRKTKIYLYLIYGIGCVCGMVGYSLHTSPHPVWCEDYGFMQCFGVLGLSKAFLYMFCLRRAELAQGLSMNSFKRILFEYVAPVYLFAYWILYCILTEFVFSSKYVTDPNRISNCYFDKGAWWFCIFSAFFELLNTVGSLALFIHPLLRAMREAEGIKLQNHRDYKKHLGYVTIMRWNIVLTTIAALTSVGSVFAKPVAADTLWLFCMGDPFVNALCTFAMIGPNRAFISRLCCCCVDSSQNDDHETTDRTRTRTRTTSASKPTSSGGKSRSPNLSPLTPTSTVANLEVVVNTPQLPKVESHELAPATKVRTPSTLNIMKALKRRLSDKHQMADSHSHSDVDGAGGIGEMKKINLSQQYLSHSLQFMELGNRPKLNITSHSAPTLVNTVAPMSRQLIH